VVGLVRIVVRFLILIFIWYDLKIVNNLCNPIHVFIDIIQLGVDLALEIGIVSGVVLS